MRDETRPDRNEAAAPAYRLDDQVGYLLRLASQRHAGIFQERISGELTATQFSALIRLSEVGAATQNHLGRLASMDVATTKGVVDRLRAKGYVASAADPTDKRRSVITLTESGRAAIAGLKRVGAEITAETLAPLSETERETLAALLRKIT